MVLVKVFVLLYAIEKEKYERKHRPTQLKLEIKHDGFKHRINTNASIGLPN